MKNSIKKILIAHSSNDNYGASKVLISTIDILIESGFEVHLLLPSNGPLNKNKIIKKTKLSIIKLGVFRKKYFTIFGLINRLFYIIKSSFQIRRILKKNQIGLVYVNTCTLISPLIAAQFIQVPSISHIHEIPNSNYLYARFIAIILNNFSRDIICVSKCVFDFWTKQGLKEYKAKIIYNGFNFKKPKSKINNNNKIVFTCVSRIIPYKGHTLLIKMFDLLCKKNSNIFLQVVGDTIPQYQSYFNKLKIDIKNRDLENNIQFLGFKDNIKSILKNSSFFIHTPISPDPLPTVIFEAIESKTPVITNDLGGAYEILDQGKNGLLIENNLIEESILKILHYIDNEREQKNNTEKAFNYVFKNFSRENFKRQILSIIE